MLRNTDILRSIMSTKNLLFFVLLFLCGIGLFRFFGTASTTLFPVIFYNHKSLTGNHCPKTMFPAKIYPIAVPELSADFDFDNTAARRQITKRLLRVITSGQYTQTGYYSSMCKKQRLPTFFIQQLFDK